MTERPECQGMPPSELSLDVTHQLGGFRLAVSANLPASGITALFGPSGSGKTSLLRLIAGLDEPLEGQLRLGDTVLTDTANRVHLPPHRRGLGVVFQEARLFPHYRVRSNLRYGQRRDDAAFARVVEQLDIRSLLARYPATLSGGEARRVALARALLTDPQMLLLDEPLTGLDATHKHELLRHIRELVANLAIPMIYISHDAREIATIADHIAILDEGQLIADGPLAEVLARVELTSHLGGFEAVSLLTGTVASHDTDYALSELRLPDGQRLTVPTVDRSVGEAVRVQVPVRDVAIATTEPTGTSYRNRLKATINEAHTSSDEPAVMELKLDLGGQVLRARLTRRSYEELDLAVGRNVVALVRAVAFDRAS